VSGTPAHVRPYLIIVLACLLACLSLGGVYVSRFLWARPKSGHRFVAVTDARQLTEISTTEHVVFVTDPELTNQELSAFLLTHDLHVLKISGCMKVTGRGLFGLENSTDLTTLLAYRTSIGDDCSTTLEQLQRLEELDLSYSNTRELSEDVFRNNPRLQSLNVAGCSVTKELIARCAAHCNLRRLDVSYCGEVVPDAISTLSKSSSLEEILIGGCRMDKSQVAQLCGMQSLRVLTLSEVTGVTRAEIGALGAARRGITIHFIE